MRVLLTTHPSLGHWHPLVPLAQALHAGGHEIAFVSTPRFCHTIEAHGFRCFAAGVEESADELRQRQAQLATLSPDEQDAYMHTHVFAGVRAARSLPDLLALIQAWRPAVVVSENTEFSGCVAAAQASLPHAAVQITAPRPHLLEVVEAPLRQLCASVGLPPCPPADLLHRYLVLSPRPASLWPPAVPVPPTTHAFRYAGFNQAGPEGLPGWVVDLDRQRPTVYATLGTAFNHMTAVFAAILDGLRDEPVNLILAIGRNRDPGEFGAVPSNVHIERYIPQSLLVPRCALVISHGGSGTMLDALSCGLPLVLLPIAADQPQNAQVCAHVGVARVIVPVGHPGLAPAIREAARTVLQDARYRQAAQRVQQEIAALPGLDYPVALLERLAAERTPIRAPINAGQEERTDKAAGVPGNPPDVR